MNRTRRLMLAAAIAIPLVGGAGTGLPTSSADPAACVYVAASVTGVTSVDRAVETEPGTCPALPPDPDDPCPGGTGLERHEHQAGVGAQVMICAKGL